jgi:hypothetical protein
MEKEKCPCCGTEKIDGLLFNCDCYNFCSDIEFHGGNPCDGSC